MRPDTFWPRSATPVVARVASSFLPVLPRPAAGVANTGEDADVIEVGLPRFRMGHRLRRPVFFLWVLCCLDRSVSVSAATRLA